MPHLESDEENEPLLRDLEGSVHVLLALANSSFLPFRAERLGVYADPAQQHMGRRRASCLDTKDPKCITHTEV